ncbi:MAG: HlyD family efflux transporter periplasmic adaptor subunit [Psittacicella sp.]
MEETSDKNLQAKNKKSRVRLISYFIIALVIIGVCYGIYWAVFLSNKVSTDDAYVTGNQIEVSSQVSGNIEQLNVKNTQYVKQGQVLAILNKQNYKLAYQDAQISLANSVQNAVMLQYTIATLQDQANAQASALKNSQEDLVRANNSKSTISAQTLNNLQNEVNEESYTYKATLNKLKAEKALFVSGGVENQPNVKSAIVNLKTSWLNLQRAVIVAPESGYIAQLSSQVGEAVSAGSSLFEIIPSNQMWVDANFKETQLRNIKPGDKVRITFDIYGSKVFNGKVVGLQSGTGSAFSLIPAENATGNWIKIIQRVPVRIALDQNEVAKNPLIIGLSSNVTVYPGKEANKGIKSLPLSYKTNTLTYNMTYINDLIAKIIKDNE